MVINVSSSDTTPIDPDNNGVSNNISSTFWSKEERNWEILKRFTINKDNNFHHSGDINDYPDYSNPDPFSNPLNVLD